MIPQQLHYCWFGKGPKSALNQRCMAAWLHRAKALPRRLARRLRR